MKNKRGFLLIMGIYEKPIASSVVNVLPKISNKMQMSFLTTPTQHCMEAYSYCNKARKGNM